MHHFTHYLARFVTFFAFTLALSACQPNQSDTRMQYKPERGQSVIAFTDAVPVFRKNGVFWKYGANHNSILKSPIAQDYAEFELYENKGIVIWTPDVGPINPTSYAYFQADKPQLNQLIPFINIGDTLHIMQSDSANELCSSLTAAADNANRQDNDSLDVGQKSINIETFFEAYAKVSPRLFDYIGDKIQCTPFDETGDKAWMIPLETSNSPSAMGVFFKGKKGQTITIKNFHLGHNLPVQANDEIYVKAEKTLDGKIPTQLHLLTHNGVKSVMSSKNAGKFTLPRTQIEDGPFRLWVDDNNLAIFPAQGEWIDPEFLTGRIIIKQTAEFPIDESNKKKNKNKRKRVPHKLSVWTGSSNLVKIQEYEGLTFKNNLGYADRDRIADNKNNCLRGVIFGGSYVEAEQTKITEKPALMTEAFVSQKLRKCVEFLTYARSRGRAENFINDAKELINNFDIDFIVFSISGTELCGLNDDFYVNWYGRGLMTPNEWRIVNGKIIPPVPQDKAEIFNPNKEAAKAVIKDCKYKKGALSATAQAPLEKLKTIENLLKLEKQDLQVLHFNFKDILAKQSKLAKNIQRHCSGYNLQCYILPEPSKFKFDESENRFSPYLYRYKQDAHPNVRANQYIAHGLTDMLTEIYKE